MITLWTNERNINNEATLELLIYIFVLFILVQQSIYSKLDWHLVTIIHISKVHNICYYFK